MNNSRRKLVNGEHNRPGQKAKHGGSHSPAGASRRRRLGCCQAQGRGISPQISIYHLNHVSLPAIGRKNGTTEWRGKGEAAAWRASRTREQTLCCAAAERSRLFSLFTLALSCPSHCVFSTLATLRRPPLARARRRIMCVDKA